MHIDSLSTRPFIGAKNFTVSRAFYEAIGFEVKQVGQGLCLCTSQNIQFYLQDAYVRDWIDNTMIFIEVADVDQCYQDLAALELDKNFENARLTPICHENWGSECFLHDPSGILWHFGSFSKT